MLTPAQIAVRANPGNQAARLPRMLGASRLSLVPVLAVVLIGVFAPAASAKVVPPAGRWVMRGVVVDAHNLDGARVGTKLTRTWVFRRCGARCLRVSTERYQGGFDRHTVRLRGRYWIGTSPYARTCASGERVVAASRLKFRVTRSVRRDGRQLASKLDGTFRGTSPGCTGDGPTREVWTYSATRKDLPPAPAAPTADIGIAPELASYSVAAGTSKLHFSDDSTDDRDSGRIVTRAWNFGDPASGEANASDLQSPQHTYTKPGSYRVTLTVTDDDGRTDTTRRVVVIDP